MRAQSAAELRLRVYPHATTLRCMHTRAKYSRVDLGVTKESALARVSEKRSSETPCVHIVDDDGGVRECLVWLLQSVGLKSAQYASAAEFHQRRPADPRGCLVLDIRMPGESGLQLQRTLRESGVTLPVVFLTGCGETQVVVEAFKGGAVDFIEKPFGQQAVLEKVQAALRLDAQLEAERARVREGHERLQVLTTREREVLELLVEGQSNKEVAHTLSVALKTVETHRARIMLKTEATSFAELVRVVLASKSPQHDVGTTVAARVGLAR